MKKSWLAFGSVAAATVAALFTVKQYRQWQDEEIERIEAGGLAVETTMGPVEYSVEGELDGRPVVIIAHGSPGGYDQGALVAKLLNAPDLAFICVSRPGYLHTPLSSGRTPAIQADLYAALLDALRIQKAAILGVSGGGPSALQFALRHPDCCSGLIMLSALAGHYTTDEVYAPLSPSLRLLKRLTDFLLLWNPAVFLLARLSEAMPQVVTPETFHALAISALRRPGYDNDMEQFATIDYPLERITVPTLALHGTADIDAPIAHAELVEASIPGAKLIRVEGGTHLFFGTPAHSDMTGSAIRAFVASLA